MHVTAKPLQRRISIWRDAFQGGNTRSLLAPTKTEPLFFSWPKTPLGCHISSCSLQLICLLGSGPFCGPHKLPPHFRLNIILTVHLFNLFSVVILSRVYVIHMPSILMLHKRLHITGRMDIHHYTGWLKNDKQGIIRRKPLSSPQCCVNHSVLEEAAPVCRQSLLYTTL